MSREIDSSSAGMLHAARPLTAPPRRPKTGGRKAGTPNKRTVERQCALDAIKASGKDPISFFADLLRNETAPLELRFQAAKELAPFVHPSWLALRPGRAGTRMRTA